MGFEIFGLTVKLYGIMLTAGILAGLITIVILFRQRHFDPNVPYTLVLLLVPVAILCARWYYIVFSDKLTMADFFDLSNGGFQGLAIYGAVIGGFVMLVIYCRIRKISLIVLTDILVPALILGQAIGRWGNFFNQEAYGKAVDFDFFPLTVFIDNGYDYGPHLATFFYESILNLIGFIVLLIIFKKQKRYGYTTAGYLIWYGLTRMIVEPLRTDSLLITPGSDFVFNRVSFVLSIALVVIGMVLLYLNKKGKISQNDQNLYQQHS